MQLPSAPNAVAKAEPGKPVAARPYRAMRLACAAATLAFLAGCSDSTQSPPLETSITAVPQGAALPTLDARRHFPGGVVPASSLYSISGDISAASVGDKLREITGAYSAACGVNTGIAFDGVDLIMSCWYNNRLDVLSAVNGSLIRTITVPGYTGFGALAWDGSQDKLWACGQDATGFSNVVLVDMETGASTKAFTGAFTDGYTGACVDGLAYDGLSNTLWMSADVATNIYQYEVDGTLLGTRSITGKLGGSNSSGIAVGGEKIYLANNGGQKVFELAKDFSTSVEFAALPRRLEDLECDDVTFAADGKAAMWVQDAYDRILVAFEIPAGSCSFGGGAPPVSNNPPTADAGGPYTGAEGSSVSLSLSGSDPDDDVLTYTWDLGDGTTGSGSAADVPGSHTYADNGVYTISLTVEDTHGAKDTQTAQATIANVAPTIASFTTYPSGPVAIGTSVSLAAPYSDPGVLDTHTGDIDWGDGTISTASIDPFTSISGSHTYAASGVYDVTFHIADNDGGTDSRTFELVVVYVADVGFVTGGGWIDSPAGAYAPDPLVTGEARFGFVSKYLPGRNTPDGQTQFQFKAAGLNFHSVAYDWLVVSGPKAQFKGTGTINGAGDYGFLLTANDGQVNGGGGVDRLRLKIWERATGDIVYDNQSGDDDDDAAASLAITRGSIVIHNGRK